MSKSIVTKRAVEARLRRHLASKCNLWLKKSRSKYDKEQFGEYFAANGHGPYTVVQHCGSLLEIADTSKANILAPFEEMEK